MRSLSLRTAMQVERLALFQWHLAKGSFERMIPPWIQLRCKGRYPDPADLNMPYELILKKGMRLLNWKLTHSEFIWGQLLQDKQVEGPFESWRHTMRFLPGEGDKSYLEDEIEFEIGGALTSWFEEKIKRILEYRHEILLNDLNFFKKYPDKKLKVLLSGGSGFIGSKLKAFLMTAGHEVWTLKRSHELEDREIYWDPGKGQLHTKDLEGFDAIIHLAGENVGSLFWTEELKKKIVLSRVHSTWLLSKAISRLQNPPEAFIFASGMNYYGSKFTHADENSPKRTGFMSDLAADIEKSALTASSACRVIPLRMAAVLAMDGGFLEKMLKPAKFYTRLSTGNPMRHVAWIDREDVLRGIYHILFNKEINGPVNFIAPERSTEISFWNDLRKAMKRKVLFPIWTGWMKKISPILYDELIAADQGEIESKLIRGGLQFSRPSLKEALKYCDEY